MTVGKNIKNIRKERGMTQIEFANKVGISRTYLSDLENDRKNISTKTLQTLSEKLNVSTSYITTGKKMLRDLTNEDIATEFSGLNEKMNKDKESQLTYITSIFDKLKQADLTIIDVHYLTNALNFFSNATSDEINHMQVLLKQLNKYYDAKYSDDYSNEEIQFVYNDMIQDFDNFLKSYLGLNK